MSSFAYLRDRTNGVSYRRCAAGRYIGPTIFSVFCQEANRELVGRFEDAGAYRATGTVPTTYEEGSPAELDRITEAVLG